jgi:hypothetical protein
MKLLLLLFRVPPRNAFVNLRNLTFLGSAARQVLN